MRSVCLLESEKLSAGADLRARAGRRVGLRQRRRIGLSRLAGLPRRARVGRRWHVRVARRRWRRLRLRRRRAGSLEDPSPSHTHRVPPSAPGKRGQRRPASAAESAWISGSSGMPAIAPVVDTTTGLPPSLWTTELTFIGTGWSANGSADPANEPNRPPRSPAIWPPV